MHCRILHCRARNVARGFENPITSFVETRARESRGGGGAEGRFIPSKAANEVNAQRDCATPVQTVSGQLSGFTTRRASEEETGVCWYNTMANM
jgi:hypothetical protein